MAKKNTKPKPEPVETPPENPEVQTAPPIEGEATPPAETPPVEEVIPPDPWWEVQAGDLPKCDIQAPNEQVAAWLYKRRWWINQPEPTAKRVT